MKKRKTLLEGGKGKGSLPPTRRDKVNTTIRKIENRVADTVNPYSDPVRGIINTVGGMQVGDKVVDPNAINLLHGANNTLNNIVKGTVGALIPGGSTPLRDKLEQRRARQSRAQEAYDENVEDLSRVDERKDMAEGGDMNDQMNALAISVAPAKVEEMPSQMSEQTMLPDEEMEEDYVDYVVNATLDEQDKNYLESALAEDAKLSEIFDQVIESATEFSGSGPIEGPGNEKSDSIPARLSDGEFVFTAKATEEIGSDNLMSMMKDAEAAANERQSVAYGGMIDEEDQAVPIPTTASRAAQGNVPNVVKQSRQVEEEMLKSSPRRYYVPVSG